MYAGGHSSPGGPYLTSLELSQLQFHTSLLLSLKILGQNQLTTFVVDYDKINYRN